MATGQLGGDLRELTGRDTFRDMGGHDLQIEETLGLNCAWYADILLTLTT